MASAIATATLVACGGGGSGSISPITLSGKVIDGYIKNAKVCLDLNANLKCDDGPGQEEAPYTVMSGEKGSYSFVYTGTRDVAALHIIAEATADSMDEDDLGKTFAEANRNAVSLLTPANAPETITPMSTLVSHQQIVAKEEGKSLSLADAESRAKLAANIPANVSLVSNDYKDATKGNTDLAVIAKAVTLSLADAQATIKNNEDFKSASGSSGKSSAAEAIKQSIASVNSDLAKNISADGKLAVSVTQFQNTTAKTISGNIQDIVRVAATPASKAWEDPGAYIQKGMYFLSIQAGAWFGDGKTPESAKRVDGPVPELSGVKQNNAGTKFYSPDVDWSIKTPGGAYEKTYKWSPDFFLSDKGWVKESGTGIADVTRKDNCFLITEDEQIQEVCGKITGWAGKTVEEAGFCTTTTKNTFFKTCANPNLKFPQDAFSNDFSITSVTDRYRMWGVDGGPDAVYAYQQTGTTITVNATNHQVDVGWKIILDFKSGAGVDGVYEVASKINDDTFTVKATTAASTQGNVVRYWGGWNNFGVDFNGDVTLVNFIKEQMKYADNYFSMENCSILGKFVTDAASTSGYAISWSKGKSTANGSCAVDTSNDAKKYSQKTPVIFETVKGQQILRTIASDIYKVEKDEYYGVEPIWAVVTNSAGVKGIYQGETEKAAVKRVIESGSKQAIGNRAFIETINKAWGYADLPSEAALFNNF